MAVLMKFVALCAIATSFTVSAAPVANPAIVGSSSIQRANLEDRQLGGLSSWTSLIPGLSDWLGSSGLENLPWASILSNLASLANGSGSSGTAANSPAAASSAVI